MRSGTALCSAPNSTVASRWPMAMRCTTGAGDAAFTHEPGGAMIFTGR